MIDTVNWRNRLSMSTGYRMLSKAKRSKEETFLVQYRQKYLIVEQKKRKAKWLTKEVAKVVSGKMLV